MNTAKNQLAAWEILSILLLHCLIYCILMLNQYDIVLLFV